MIKSIFCDSCWICGVRFRDSNPPGPAVMERHHIIPRAAGGADGPTVDICESHHQILHKIALRLSSKKPYLDLIGNETPEQRKKLYFLATRVYNAFQATKDDPNKKVAAIVELDRKQQDQITQLMNIYPQCKSREAVLALALEVLFNKHFSRK